MAGLFPVYSIAKSFLAQSVLELQIPLDELIGQQVIGIPEIYANRPIGKVLNHSSGLADYSELAEYNLATERDENPWCRQELFDRCMSLNNSNEAFHYSNIGYLLLRMLVEQHTGLSMFDAIKELVLDPLGIQGFESWEQRSTIIESYNPGWVYSGTFAANEPALLEGFLKLVKHRAQTTGLALLAVDVPYPNTGFDHPAYGVGLMMDKSPDSTQPTFVGHGGGGPGFSHMILVNTTTWKVALETSRSDFNQTAAIARLREETSR